MNGKRTGHLMQQFSGTPRGRSTLLAFVGFASILISLLPAPLTALDSPVGHPNFLSPHAGPIAESGGLVFAVNTPADSVDVIDTLTRNLVARIPVGIDPVGLAVRPDGRELWVSNHVSDSVSVIDIEPGSPTRFQVLATIQDIDPQTGATRFDEPVGIAFAGHDKAYVALSSENQVAVIDARTRQLLRRLTIPAQDPRAIAVRDGRLYVLPFESGNQTQISGCTNPAADPLCTFDAIEHVVNNNNVLSRHIVVDVIRDSRIPDRDLFVFDTATDQLVEVVDSIGTLLYGLTVDSSGRVFVAQTDARNDANGRAGTLGEGLAEMENRAFLNQLSQIDCADGSCGQPLIIDLEPAPPAQPPAGSALATPFAIRVSGDDATLIATAAGSNRLFTLDSRSGELLGQVAVGRIPRGIALQEDESGRALAAWVLNVGDNSVSLVDVSDAAHPMLLDTVTLPDPTHPAVKRGRIAFNDAGASTSGTFSCESCHPDGGTDQVVWVLDTPPCNLAGCDQVPPRITLPIRGLSDTAPYHWDGIPGDPYGGNNTANIRGSDVPNCDRNAPESCTRNLVDGSLASTMCDPVTCPLNEAGRDGALTTDERDDMAKFLLSVPYPPAQRRAVTDALSPRARDGFRLFHIDGDLQGDPQPNVCGNCHRMPFWVSTNTPGTGMDAPTWRGAYDRWLILPQGRLNLIDLDFYRNIAQQGVPERSVWQLSWAGRARFDPVWDMVLEGSTGFSGAFARSVTLNRDSAALAETAALLDALESAARSGAVILQGEGVLLDGAEAGEIALEFDHRFNAASYVDRGDDPRAFTRSELVERARSGAFLGTFTARLGPRVDVDHPQPALWSMGPIEEQRGPQIFPTLTADGILTIAGRHIDPGANLFVDGRRVPGSVRCRAGELPDCQGEVIEVQPAALPPTSGLHFLQVQNPGGLFSNEYIFFSQSGMPDNCPDIPGSDRSDSDNDGVGDRCDDDAFDFELVAGISGNWYDPAHNGEGWFVEMLDESRALVYWFTYTPPGEGGASSQAWIGGVGEIRGSSIVIDDAAAYIGKGPQFGPGFDPNDVDLRPWGKLVLSFRDCDSGVMYYRSNDPDYGHGTMDLTRLTHIGTLGCGDHTGSPPVASGNEFRVTAAITGAWYDPAHDGEGWLLEILDDGQALLAWFTYDPQGNQAWFFNTGIVDGDRITFDLLQPAGPDFGPTYDREKLNLPRWGTATFTFEGCDSGSMTYESEHEGYGSGSLTLTRLTGLAGLDCL